MNENSPTHVNICPIDPIDPGFFQASRIRLQILHAPILRTWNTIFHVKKWLGTHTPANFFSLGPPSREIFFFSDFRFQTWISLWNTLSSFAHCNPLVKRIKIDWDPSIYVMSDFLMHFWLGPYRGPLHWALASKLLE